MGKLMELLETDIYSIEIDADDHRLLTKHDLSKLYETGKKLLVKAKKYVLTIEGEKIENCENELSTEIIFISSRDGDYFILNEGKSLPGFITIEIEKKAIEIGDGGKYMLGNYKKIEADFDEVNGVEKFSFIMLAMQIIFGLLTILISVLYLTDQLGSSSIVIVIPALVCCLLATVNLVIITFQKTNTEGMY